MERSKVGKRRHQKIAIQRLPRTMKAVILQHIGRAQATIERLANELG